MSPARLRAVPAIPEYDIGDVVFYTDRQLRPQRGEVLRIEASWGWRAGLAPLITYTLHHPTYRDNRFHAGLDSIGGLVERASS